MAAPSGGGPEWLRWKYPEWYMQMSHAQQEENARACLRGLTLDEIAATPSHNWLDFQDIQHRSDAWQTRVVSGLARRAREDYKQDATGERWRAFAAATTLSGMWWSWTAAVAI